MGKGRKPQSTSLKALKGNPGKRAIKEDIKVNEPLPECPQWLDDVARDEWNRLIPMVSWVRGPDAMIFAAYCKAFSRSIEAEVLVAKQGMVSSTSTGGIKRHPAVSIAMESTAQMKSLAAELGLTPTSRLKLPAAAAVLGLKLKKFVG